MSRLWLFLVIALAGLTLTGCTPPADPWAPAPAGQPKVLASFPPIYCFAANVAGDKAFTLCLLTGTGPHDYDATPMDARKVVGSDLFFANGLSIDTDFCKKLIRLARGTNAKLVLVGDDIPTNLLLPMRQHEGHVHEGDYDPHAWLGVKPAQAMVRTIAGKLADFDPPNKAVYQKNADDYIAKIERDVFEYGQEKFKNKSPRSLITMHESLGYFAKSFGLDLVDSIQAQPGDEADANRLSRLAEECRKKNVSVIAVEPQYRRGQADTLAKALKNRGLPVKVVDVDPMETAAPGTYGNPSPNLYIERMRKNIDALADAFPDADGK